MIIVSNQKQKPRQWNRLGTAVLIRQDSDKKTGSVRLMFNHQVKIRSGVCLDRLESNLNVAIRTILDGFPLGWGCMLEVGKISCHDDGFATCHCHVTWRKGRKSLGYRAKMPKFVWKSIVRYLVWPIAELVTFTATGAVAIGGTDD